MVQANKALGQHWLNDEPSLMAVIQAADVIPNDSVVEVGPGLGSLTKLLVAKASRVIAIELDSKLASKLKSRVKADNLTVINENILKFDFEDLPSGYKLVANLPYYLTAHFIRLISESANPPLSCGLLIQKEVAERLNARPGQMSLLAVTAQYYWHVSLGRIVPAGLFEPPPKVDSQIVSLKRRTKPLFDNVEPDLYFRLVRAGFSQKRKTLLNSLSTDLKLEKKTIKQCLDNAQIDPSRRAQSLSLEEWYQLYICIN